MIIRKYMQNLRTKVVLHVEHSSFNVELRFRGGGSKRYKNVRMVSNFSTQLDHKGT